MNRRIGDTFEIKALDNQKSKKEPSVLAKIPFTMYIVAGKGGGKTTLVINLLRQLDRKFNKIIWISPTARFDQKVTSLATENLTSPNYLYIQLLNELRKHKQMMDSIQPSIPTNGISIVEKMSIEDLQDIVSQQHQISSVYGKEFSDNILLVFDDSILDDLLKSRAFADIVFKSRHYKMSMIFISQSYFGLPKKLRLNNSQLILFETGNKKELESIYTENHNGKSFQEFMNMYQQCVDEPYGFLNINYDNFKSHRFINKFSSFI